MADRVLRIETENELVATNKPGGFKVFLDDKLLVQVEVRTGQAPGLDMALYPRAEFERLTQPAAKFVQVGDDLIRVEFKQA